jgi:hypothetical protein
MSVPRGRGGLAVAKKLTNHGERQTKSGSGAGVSMAQIVNAHIVQFSPLSYAPPCLAQIDEVTSCDPSRDHVWAALSPRQLGQVLDDCGTHGSELCARLRVLEAELATIPVDLIPAEGQDLV